ncbi:hypothetical protein [Spiroplasma diminutum]|uniref:Transmembrane protein n=1 Tax=Spiroplasma diminutum CUAS-1 TaxID=1276221 RepID=S5MIY8_9MOLU|nr:hypothetical protein [Spiroplasma diminutum]AGR41905.1 hypothetical protein SDIMI_v3c02010 [Spiroplasma diminutum CUAS-1]
MDKFPWWVILIIILVVLVLYFVIPWNKINKKNKEKSDLVNDPKEFIDSEIDKKITEIKEDTRNKPMLGVYNWFGKKEALRLKTLVYVQPEEDCCELCRPFENQILSLEQYDKYYLTMSEAISKGYHHIGCKHIDIDYFAGVTNIADKHFSEEDQIKLHNKVLGLYKLENQIRNYKYEYDNVNSLPEIKLKIEELSDQIDAYCLENKLKRNIERENPNISDLDKFR